MDKFYTKQLQLNKDGKDDGKFARYEWTLTSTSVNTYGFHMSLQALKSMRNGLKQDTVPLMLDHEYSVHNVIGRVVSARLKDNSQLIGNLRLQRGLPLSVGTTDDLIDKISAGSLTSGSIGFDFNDSHFNCQYGGCGEKMQMFMGFAFCEKGHVMGEYDDKGNRMTAELVGNPTIYEFSLAYQGADPSAEIVSELEKVMSEHDLGAGALQAAAELQGFHYGNLCQTLGIDPKATNNRRVKPTLIRSGKMAKPDVLSDINDQLQTDNEALQERNDELEKELAERPTQEEYDQLQRDNTALQTELDSDDREEMKRLAEQGKAYIEVVRTEAKDAYKTKLMADGVKRADVDEHPDYLSQCRDYDEIDDVKVLYKAAQSHYRSARSNRAAGRVSKELNNYTTATEGDNVRFASGANDVR